MKTSKFEITRRNPSPNASGKYAAEAKRGIALGAHATDPESFSLAEHNNFIGHLTRDVVDGGLSLADRVFGRTSATPVGLESPFTKGEEVTLEKAHEIECEGPDYFYSGTGQINSATAVPSNISFKEGKFRVTQTNETVNYILTANNLDPHEEGQLRIRLERV